MTDTAIATTEPTRQAIATQGRSAPLKVTGKLRDAIEQMVWYGLTRSEAAAKAGLTEHALYVAFRKPHVKAHYLGELEVLRTSERARNIHTLVEVRDQTKNQMARVNAVAALEQSAETQGRSTGSVSLPGLTIQIITQSSSEPVTRTIEHDEVPK